MGYNDCRHGAEMCDECLDIMSDGIRQGAEEERERIIALLEENALINESDGKFFKRKQGEYSRTFGEALRYAVALIKGENK